MITPCSFTALGQHDEILTSVPLIFCETSRSLSGTDRFQKDNSYNTQIHKASVLAQPLSVKGFVGPVN